MKLFTDALLVGTTLNYLGQIMKVVNQIPATDTDQVDHDGYEGMRGVNYHVELQKAGLRDRIFDRIDLIKYILLNPK